MKVKAHCYIQRRLELHEPAMLVRLVDEPEVFLLIVLTHEHERPGRLMPGHVIMDHACVTNGMLSITARVPSTLICHTLISGAGGADRMQMLCKMFLTPWRIS